jgi:hypothetical protein
LTRAALVLLACAAFAAEPETWAGVARVVAVGDVHGDYDRFVQVLQSAGVVNKKRNWSGGKTHLVQLGDVPDRGPHTRKVLDLLMKLEKQARKAGGRVHPLIGNHEAMNAYGDLRYTTPEEFGEFRTIDSEELRQEDKPLGFVEHRHAWGPDGKYGKWVRGNNAVVRIDDTLFVHGGISPKYVLTGAAAINGQVRAELELPVPPEDGILRDEDGPLWYRGLAQEDGIEPHVDAVLQAYGVKRIVIGHTPTRSGIVKRFGGKVILADVGLSAYYGGPAVCVVVEKGEARQLPDVVSGLQPPRVAVQNVHHPDLLQLLR